MKIYIKNWKKELKLERKGNICTRKENCENYEENRLPLDGFQ